ncbi:hypothetical protein NQZ68_022917 [Dissostichus eleginoides]|nr:hypothetical protein NQZ68_022917 [Dissostichus eleginoides]
MQRQYEKDREKGEHSNLSLLAPSGGSDSADVPLFDFHGILRIRTKTTRLRDSFIPQAIRLLNT